MLSLLIEIFEYSQVGIPPFPLGLTTTTLSLEQVFPDQAKPRGGHSFSHSTLSGRGVFIKHGKEGHVILISREGMAITNKLSLKVGNKSRTVNTTNISNIPIDRTNASNRNKETKSFFGTNSSVTPERRVVVYPCPENSKREKKMTSSTS